MWTHASFNVELVWETVLWRMVAIWQEAPGVDPVVLERSGSVQAPADDGPLECLAAGIAAAASQRPRAPWLPVE